MSRSAAQGRKEHAGASTERAVRLAVSAALLSALPFGANPGAAHLTLVETDRVLQSELGGLVESLDRFGRALAAGDFDGNGVEDLAVGAPGEDVGAILDAGAVFVAYNSQAGFAAALPSLVLHQDVSGVGGVAEAGDQFGWSLAVGNVNADAYDDLAVGIPFEDAGGFQDTGAVQLFLGSASGLVPATTGHLLLSDDIPFFSLEEETRFGFALVLCDRNDDGRDDLVIGAPSRGPTDVPPLRPGRVFEIPGSPTGVAAGSANVLMAHDFDDGDEFGFALACGVASPLEGEYLAVGAPGSFDEEGVDRTGAVWTYDENGDGGRTIDGAGLNEKSGEAVVLGRFNNRNVDELVWSVPGDNMFTTPAVGRVFTSRFVLDQEGGGDGDAPEFGDRFGQVLAAGDFDGNGYEDLAIGTPSEDLPIDGGGELFNGGMVQVLAGPIGSGPPAAFVSKLFLGSMFDFEPQQSEEFGRALATGDFDADGFDDLAIGVPGADWNGEESTGFVQIVYGSGLIFADGFESGDTDAWSDSAP